MFYWLVQGLNSHGDIKSSLHTFMIVCWLQCVVNGSVFGDVEIFFFEMWFCCFQVPWTWLWGTSTSTWQRQRDLQDTFGPTVSCTIYTPFVDLWIEKCAVVMSFLVQSWWVTLPVLSVEALTRQFLVNCSDDGSLSVRRSQGKDESRNQAGTGGRFWGTL